MKNGKLIFYRRGFWLVLLFAALAVIGLFLSDACHLMPPLTSLFVFGGSFALATGLYFLIAYRFSAGDTSLLDTPMANSLLSSLYEHPSPACVVGRDGGVVWCNTAFSTALSLPEIPYGRAITLLSSVREPFLKGPAGVAEQPVVLGRRMYKVSSRPFESGDERMVFLSFDDVSEKLTLSQELRDEKTVVAYIVIDNIDEILQFVQERYSKCAADVEEKLKSWLLHMNGIFRPYENDKYVAVFSVRHLTEVIKGRFSILDEIRSIRVGDGMSITVSMGVANTSGTLAEREADAKAALDLALQRGGDQVVYRSDSGTEFYGGRTKAIYKRNNVRARVMAGQIASLIGRADNVLVMAHRFADFDALASAVGMSRLARFYGANVNVVINEADPGIARSLELLREIPEYEDVFVDGPEAMDLVRPDTLLIVTDVNNFQNTEYPPLVRNVRQIAVIDHHRKTADFSVKPVLSYIETSASSASELVSEILEQALPRHALLKEEAELLLSGILLDTQRFTRNTGTRTFGIARYLRSEGADPTATNELFKSDIADVVKEAKFHSNIHTYRDCLAITVCEDIGDSSYTIAAAKAADKLLSARHVEASFALVRVENKIHISARSAGKVNVQLILEKLNGGGHFDVAGAKVDSEDAYAVVERLKEAIDEYFEKYPDALSSHAGTQNR